MTTFHARPGYYTQAIMECQGQRLKTAWHREDEMLRWSLRHFAQTYGPSLRVLYLVNAIVPARGARRSAKGC